MNKQDIAKQDRAPTPKDAKFIAFQLKIAKNSMQLADWGKIKVDMMDFILRVKWNCCAKFRQALLSTDGMVIAEATFCDFWGVGVAPNLAQHTKVSKFPGQNNMGKLQMALRCYVSQPDMLNDAGELTLPLKPPYNGPTSPESSVVTIIKSLTLSPDPNGQGDFLENNDGAFVQKSCASHTAADDAADRPPFNNDVRSTDFITSVSIDCEAPESQEVLSTSGVGSAPKLPPRKKKMTRRPAKTSSRRNTLDNFVNKESPSCKRKPSGDAGSPTSTQDVKLTRTGGSDKAS